MTEAEWFESDSPFPMLIYLRGDVSEERKDDLLPRMQTGYGELFFGPGQHINGEQCRAFILECIRDLAELPLDVASQEFIGVYRRYANGHATREELYPACCRVEDAGRSAKWCLVNPMAYAFWTLDPAGALAVADDIATAVALVRSEESLAQTCADATEEDWAGWSFAGGPPDPLFQTERESVFCRQAGILRAIVGNPFANGCKECEYGDS